MKRLYWTKVSRHEATRDSSLWSISLRDKLDIKVNIDPSTLEELFPRFEKRKRKEPSVESKEVNIDPFTLEELFPRFEKRKRKEPSVESKEVNILEELLLRLEKRKEPRKEVVSYH